MSHAYVGTQYRNSDNYHSIVEVIETTGDNAMDPNGHATYKYIQHPRTELVGTTHTLRLLNFNSQWLDIGTHNTAKGTDRKFVTNEERKDRLNDMQRMEDAKWNSMTTLEQEKETKRLKEVMAQEALIALGESAI